MKKTLILALAALTLSAGNALASNELDLKVHSSISNPNQLVGTVVELTENGGKLMDQTTGEVKDFYHPGAHIDFIIGETVTYILITLPNGTNTAATGVRGQKAKAWMVNN